MTGKNSRVFSRGEATRLGVQSHRWSAEPAVGAIALRQSLQRRGWHFRTSGSGVAIAEHDQSKRKLYAPSMERLIALMAMKEGEK